jgi:hypothetical protein
LVKASERFVEFHLKVGDVEIELRRRRAVGHAAPASISQSCVAARSSRADTEA